MNPAGHRVEVREHEEGFAFIEIPVELLEELGWEVNDEILIEETDVGDGGSDTQELGLRRSIL